MTVITPIPAYVKSTPNDLADDLKTAMDALTITHLYAVSTNIVNATAWAYFVYD